MNEDEAIANIYKKIEREKGLLNGANAMRQQTNNDAVRSRLDSQMREARRNIQFFEEKIRDLQLKRVGSGMENMSISSGSTSTMRPASGDMHPEADNPPPPPKDDGGWSGGDRGSYGTLPYSQIGAHGDMMPPRHPFAPPGPSSSIPKPRPNFTKLGVLASLPYNESYHGSYHASRLTPLFFCFPVPQPNLVSLRYIR